MQINPASGELLNFNFLASSPWVFMDGIWIDDSTAICRAALLPGEFIGPIVNTGVFETDVLFKYSSSQGVLWHSLLQSDQMSFIGDLKLLSTGNFVANISSSTATSISIFGEQFDLPAPESGWSHGGILCFTPNGEVVWDLFPDNSSMSTLSQVNLEIINDLDIIVFGRSFDVLTINGQDLPQADNFRLSIDTEGAIIDHQILNTNLIWIGNAVPLSDDRMLIQGYFEEPPVLDTLNFPYALPGIVLAEISDSGNWNWAYALSGQYLVAHLSKGTDNSIYLKTQCFGPLEIPGLDVPNTPYTNTHIFRLSEECLTVIATSNGLLDCSDESSDTLRAQVIGGTPPFAYLWNTNDTTPELIGQPPGVYHIAVTDAEGCLAEGAVYSSGPSPGPLMDLLPIAVAYPYFRPGIQTNLHSVLMNSGCLSINGSLKVTLDTLIDYVSGLTPEDIQDGDTLTLFMDEVTYVSTQARELLLEANAMAQIGDTVCIDITALPIENDIDTANNHIQVCYPIVNSYDPNDKQVFPAGSGPQGFIPADTRLTYMIRFQNTGNAPAFNVFIDDTLDMDLDIMDLQVHGSSHPMYLEILDDRVLRFRFDDINLPDSLSDEANSHGYVVYSIPLMPGSTGGTTIENTAYIYFDLNPPVITNTTLNTINLNTDLSELVHDHLLRAWPNPVDEQLHVSIPGALQGTEMRIIDTQGRLIHRSVATADRLVVDTGSWAAGVYAITVGNIAVRVVK